MDAMQKSPMAKAVILSSPPYSMACQRPAINAYRDFWSGIEPGARGFDRRRHEIFAQQSLWQPGVAIYHQWRGRKKISLRSASGKYRHQHWRGRAHGVLPIQRMERQFLRHFARAGPRRGGVLHRIENSGSSVGRGRKPENSNAAEVNERPSRCNST